MFLTLTYDTVLNKEEEGFYGHWDHTEMWPPGGLRWVGGREGEEAGKAGVNQVIQVLECLVLVFVYFPLVN